MQSTITNAIEASNPPASATRKPSAKRKGDAQQAAHAALAPIPDAYAYAGIGRSTLYTLVAAGELRLVKVGTRSLIDMASMRALIGRLPEASLRGARQ
jgi:excisionase family DNA binding protein